jgi:hypothetical protein
MQYTQLGNSGPTVSRMALGAMTFGGHARRRQDAREPPFGAVSQMRSGWPAACRLGQSGTVGCRRVRLEHHLR